MKNSTVVTSFCVQQVNVRHELLWGTFQGQRGAPGAERRGGGDCSRILENLIFILLLGVWFRHKICLSRYMRCIVNENKKETLNYSSNFGKAGYRFEVRSRSESQTFGP